MSDEWFMRIALRLATRGRGAVAPNPLVGAVIVDKGKMVAQGWHRLYKDLHAEVAALQQLPSAQGLTLYCNLEPCAGPWEGKHQPSCARAIIAAGIRRVVIAELDSNVQVRGKGCALLEAAGIEVKVGVLAAEAAQLNEIYHHVQCSGLPFVHLKAAISLDGCIATQSRDSAWLSSLASRREVHRLRAQYDAVLVGSGTLLQDDPQLTVRHARGRNPRRLVLCSDPRKIASTVQIFTEPKDTVIVTAEQSHNLPSQVQTLICPLESKGRLALLHVLQWMASQNMSSLLVEGGQKVFTSFIKKKLWDKMTLYIAPLFIGKGLRLLDDIAVQRMANVSRYRAKWSKSGQDCRVTIYRNEGSTGVRLAYV